MPALPLLQFVGGCSCPRTLFDPLVHRQCSLDPSFSRGRASALASAAAAVHLIITRTPVLICITSGDAPMSMDRRAFVTGSLCAAAAATAGDARGAPAAPARRIAVEEGYNIPELAKTAPAWVAQHRAQEPGEAGIFRIGAAPPPPGSVPPEPPFLRKVLDLGDGRIRDMDAAGISM